MYFLFQVYYLIRCFLNTGGKLRCNLQEISGQDSSVGIATRYGLDGPGIESRWGKDFQHPYRPALGPIQPPIQCVPGLSRE